MYSFLTLFTGVDLLIFRKLTLHKSSKSSYKALGVMTFGTVCLAGISGFYLGNQYSFAWYVNVFATFFMSSIVLVFQLFLYQTTENDLAYYNQNGMIRNVGIRKVEIIRVLVMLFLGVFILQGIKLFVFASPIEAFCQKLEMGKLSPKLLDMTKSDVQEMLHRSLLHKFMMLDIIYDSRPWILWLVNAPTLVMMCLPVMLRTLSAQLLYGEYEITKQNIETLMVIDDYEVTMNSQRFYLLRKFQVNPQRYEAFADAPFNTLRIYPPVQKDLIWDNENEIWKIKTNKVL
jgi:hypothetical protein